MCVHFVRKKEQLAVLEQAVDVYTMEFDRFLTFIRYNNARVDAAHSLIFCYELPIIMLSWCVLLNLFLLQMLISMQNLWKSSISLQPPPRPTRAMNLVRVFFFYTRVRGVNFNRSIMYRWSRLKLVNSRMIT